MNTYRLLRSNKENGPFTLEELVSKGLKPYDLVWVENRSAAWRYPSEIEELKAFAPAVEEQPYDRFYKKSEVKQEEEQHTVEPIQVKKEKPRFRVTAVSKKIESAPKANIQENIQQTVFVPQQRTYVQFEHSAFVPKETHVSGSLATFNNYTNHWNSSDDAPLETKYQGSLDDIKRRYEEKILNNKKPNFLYRYAWLLIIPILAGGIWLGYEISAKAESKGIAEIKKPILENIPMTVDSTSIVQAKNSLTEPQAQTENNNTYSALPEKSIALKKATVQQKPVVAIENRVTQKTVISKPATREDVNRTIVPEKDEFVLPPPQISEGVPSSQQRQPRVRDQKPAEKTETASPAVIVASAPVKSSGAKSKKIDDYVVVDGEYKKGNNSIQDLSLKVENVTPYPIDLVVLDIQYFDKNGRLQKGETVYAKNIAPRRDVVVNAPFGNNAYSVGYKVSLVSAEKAGLYLIAE